MSSVESPKDILQRKGLRPKKSFGQNFLVDETHLHAIARRVKMFCTKSDTPVFEIGAGLGALTGALRNEHLLVHAIERDRDLIPLLREKFGQTITLHEANALTFDFSQVASDFVLCGNLPYHLTSSILFNALDNYEHLCGAVFLVQQEVADRILAPPNNKTYGLLSVLLQARFSVEYVRNVPKGAFWPVPQVDSTVIALGPKPPSERAQVDWPSFVTLVKKAFSQRRKTLRNTLASIAGIREVLAAAQIDDGLRAENLSWQDFARLAQELARA